MKRNTRKLAVFATCLGLIGAFPVLSSADKGGVPNSHSKACKAKGKGTTKTAPNTKGKKCGFNKGTTTTSAPSTTTTETETTTTTATS